MLKLDKIAKLALLIFLLCFSSCQKQLPTKQSEKNNLLKYEIVQPEKKTITKTLILSGILKSAKTLEINANISGSLKNIYVKPNQIVQKGELLALIYCPDEFDRLKFEEKSFELAKLDLEAIKRQYELAKKLLKLDSISKEVFLDKKSQLERAELSIEKSTKSLEYLKRQLEQTKIIAPISGEITEIRYTIGSDVNSNSTLFTLSDIADLQVNANVSQEDISEIKLNTKGIFENPKLNIKPMTGIVEEIKSKSNPYSYGDSNEMEVICSLKNSGQQNLLLGSMLQGLLNLDTVQNAQSLPIEAIWSDGKSFFVYSQNNSNFKKIPVQLGLSDDQYIQIISPLNLKNILVLSDFATYLKIEKQLK